MGNVFLKVKSKKANANHKLNRNLLSENLTEKIIYLEDKLDMLDDKVFILEQHTKANLEVMSSDLHDLHQRLFDLKK